MSELAFDDDGMPFEVPATVVGWRVRRFNNPGKQGGAQVVWRNGQPLFLEAETSIEEFRDAVKDVPGKYRLDGVDRLDKHARIIEGVPPSYIVLEDPTPASVGGGYSAPPATTSSLDYAVVELARANRDAVTAMADRFSSVCDALANVVRAVDGAGLPRRAPLGPMLIDSVDDDDDDDDDDDGERNAAPPAPPATFVTVLGQVAQMVQAFTQMNGNGPAKFGAMLGQVAETAKVVEAVSTTVSTPSEPTAMADDEFDELEEFDELDEMRASSPPANETPAAKGAHATDRAPRQPTRRSTSSVAGMAPASGSAAGAKVSSSVTAADPAVQFQQIMAALTPNEQAQVQYVITRLSMGELMGWYEQLARMPVAEGVAKIRAELARVAAQASQEHAA